MTNGKPPFEPGADAERTVIKPNPGGRRDGAPSFPQRGGTAVPTGQPPRDQDIWGGPRQTPAGQPTQQSYRPPPVEPISAAPPASPQAPLPPAVDIGAISGGGAIGGPNPILSAAMPLLLLLANVRIARSVPQVAPMMSSVAQGIETFEAALQAENIPEQQVRSAKYALCATADDIVQNLPSPDRLLWTQYSMLSRFFQVRDSGIGFYDEVKKLLQHPQINHNLLGLIHACMSLGFEGKYRVAGGDAAHQQIRRDVYQTLRSREARTANDISPHWRGQDIAAAYVRRAVPLWSVASGAAGVLLLAFMVFRWLLGGYSDAAEGQMALLHPDTAIQIFRQVPTPPPPPPPVKVTTQLERIRARLKEDIDNQKLSVEYSGKDIVVRLLNDSLFDKGSASIRADYEASLVRVGQALDKEKGEIRIVGHTDNTPLRSTLKFKDNQDLSEQRAQAVGLILVSGVSDPRRLTTQGLADTAPIDTSNTPEGKARNRRVEVFIPREDL